VSPIGSPTGPTSSVSAALGTIPTQRC
jgi:hypothetical protein